MHRLRHTAVFLLAACFVIVAFGQRHASAQGLIWRLSPKENFRVVYYGSYVQVDQPARAGAKVPVVKRELIVKSLKKAKGYFDGKEVDCRWLEISVETGVIVGGEIKKINSGPGAKRIYKVLVPEEKIVGDWKDAQDVFVSMLPIATDKTGKKVMGVMKIGNSPEKPIKSPVLQVYPMLTLLQHYRKPTVTVGQGSITIAGKKITGFKNYKATQTIESRSSRSTSTAEFIVTDGTDQIPTGLGKWTVTLVREEKNSSQSRGEFKVVTTITTTLEAREITFGDATSDLKDIP